MSPKFLLPFVFCGLACTGSGSGDERWFVISSTDQVSMALDREQFARLSENHYQAWFRYELILPNEDTSVAMALFEYDCTPGRLREKQIVTHVRDSLGGYSYTDRSDGTWEPVIPETHPERIAQAVCAYGEKHTR